MIDLLLTYDNEGSNHEFKNNDLTLISGFQNMIYLALFGGNIEQSTQEFLTGEKRSDWWGNSLFMDRQPSIQFNSETERVLSTITVSTEKRSYLQSVVKQDLEVLRELGEISVFVSIPAIDSYKIEITIKEPQNSQSIQFAYIWNNTEKEMKAI
jgi:phage gp46-like protein